MELPPVTQIHPVISVTQLEPIPTPQDPYSRRRDLIHPAVTDGQRFIECDIENLVEKRVSDDGKHVR